MSAVGASYRSSSVASTDRERASGVVQDRLQGRLQRAAEATYRERHGSAPPPAARARIRVLLEQLLADDTASLSDQRLAAMVDEAYATCGGEDGMASNASLPSISSRPRSRQPPPPRFSRTPSSLPGSAAGALRPHPPGSGAGMAVSHASADPSGTGRSWADGIRADVVRFREEQRQCAARQKAATAQHRAALDKQVQERKEMLRREKEMEDAFEAKVREAQLKVTSDEQSAEEKKREELKHNKQEQARFFGEWQTRKQREREEQRQQDAAQMAVMREKMEEDRKAAQDRRNAQLRRMQEISKFQSAREDALRQRRQKGKEDEQQAAREHLKMLERQDEERRCLRDQRLQRFEQHQQLVYNMADKLGTKGNKAWVEPRQGDRREERAEHERVRNALREERGEVQQRRHQLMESTRRELDEQIQLKERQRQQERAEETRAYHQLLSHIQKVEERENGRRELKKQLELEHRKDLDRQIQVRRAQFNQSRMLGC
eukprot:TRINITY_DN2878_c0_g1_i1.p1 TRINITY_DN2878_c0_g1~~TRINITY_DN2878_c0_g1_i1.p1  ORF type:complete len:491 (+),score=204.70 TRINITY_DN2878_c0_g1_i1:82-1554(+)